MREIATSHARSRQTDDSPRVLRDLRARGRRVGRSRIRRSLLAAAGAEEGRAGQESNTVEPHF